MSLSPAMKPPAFKPPALPKPPQAASPASLASQRAVKTFSVKPFEASQEGQKIILYGMNGMGKSTLASMAPNPIFLGADDGARRLISPKTGQLVNNVPGIESFADLRDALHQVNLYPAGSTLVFDTITEYDQWGIKYTCSTVRKDGGGLAESLEDYGYGKGYTHQNDTMRILLTDCDPLIRRGVNILFLAQQGQATVANLEGADYIQDGPLMTAQPKNGANVRATVCSWCDHIFRIAYPPVEVTKANVKANKGKATGSTERIIYTEPEVYFVAKNRMNGTLPPVISFSTREDDSLWQMVFPESAK